MTYTHIIDFGAHIGALMAFCEFIKQTPLWSHFHWASGVSGRIHFGILHPVRPR